MDRGRRGRCLTTLIAAVEGPEHVPWALHVIRCVEEFLKLWRAAAPDLRSLILRAWPRIFDAVEATPRRRWLHRCRGPVSTLIVTLRQLDWMPLEPGRWRDPRGEDWIIGEPHTLSRTHIEPLLRTLRASVAAHLWERASMQRHGDGLQTGVCCKSLRRALQRYQRKGMMRERSALLTLACGAAWPAQRRHQAGLADSPLCPRCGAADEDEWHM